MSSAQGRPWLETVGFCGPSGRVLPQSLTLPLASLQVLMLRGTESGCSDTPNFINMFTFRVLVGWDSSQVDRSVSPGAWIF